MDSTRLKSRSDSGAACSGGQVDLYVSADGYASLTVPGDVGYGLTFSVARMDDPTVDTTIYPG